MLIRRPPTSSTEASGPVGKGHRARGPHIPCIYCSTSLVSTSHQCAVEAFKRRVLGRSFVARRQTRHRCWPSTEIFLFIERPRKKGAGQRPQFLFCGVKLCHRERGAFLVASMSSLCKLDKSVLQLRSTLALACHGAHVAQEWWRWLQQYVLPSCSITQRTLSLSRGAQRRRTAIAGCLHDPASM